MNTDTNITTAAVTPEEWYDRVIAMTRDGNFSDVMPELEAIVAAHPTYALAHLAMAAFWMRQEKWDDAIRCNKEYCRLEPDDVFGYTILSSQCIKAGNRAEAEAALSIAADLRMTAMLQR